jgi:hypothetical protein
MEVRLNGEELRKILCLLEPGMSLTVPDEWVDRIIEGTRAARVRLVSEIAFQHGCSHRQDYGVQKFEKLEIPATG